MKALAVRRTIAAMRRASATLRIVCLLFELPACEDDGGVSSVDAGVSIDRGLPGRDSSFGTDGETMPSADGAGLDGPSSALDASSDPVDGGGLSLPFCRLGCETVASCALPSAAYDEDNYRCAGNLCEYTGCRSDAECQATFMSSGWLCRDLGGLPTCQQACAAAADCGQGTAAFDDDNYACESGVCRYTGCATDAECASTFLDDRYVCRDVLPPDTGLPVPTARTNCVQSCVTPADCAAASAAFDADNYACEGGVCRYVGCRDDSECRASLMNDAYVCR